MTLATNPQSRKRIVVDANILIRAVLGRKVYGVLSKFSTKVQFFTPELCFEEAEEHLPRLLERRGLPTQEALTVLRDLTLVITIVPIGLYEAYEREAKQRLGERDLEDWPIIAAALMLSCPIWTEDKDFFGTGLPTWTSDKIHLFCESG